ncbi:MAG: DUF58 domain-containing protein [Suilimivivens sp.]
MILILLISVSLCMAAWQLGYYFLWDRELHVMLSFGQPYAYAGESAELTEVVENRKKLPVFLMEIGFQMKKGLLFQDMENTSVSDHVYKRDIFSLLGNQRITRRLQVQCRKRGYYTIDEVAIAAFSLLYRKRYGMRQQVSAALYVYAKRTDVSSILRAMENLLGEKESRRKYLEDPLLFASIREYTMQDPMKTINWKASARTGELMVNTYASLENERMMLYLDVEDSGILKKEHLTEECISIAATLFQKLLNKGTEVGICMNLPENGENGIFCRRPSRTRASQTLLEQRLARGWEEKDVLSFEKVLECPFQDAIPVIISRHFSGQRKQQLEAFIGPKAKGIWVIPYERKDCPQITSDRLTIVTREVECV